MPQRPIDEIKNLVEWALSKGALYVRVDDFEMNLPPPDPQFPVLAKDPEYEEDPRDRGAELTRLKEQYFDLMSHSG